MSSLPIQISGFCIDGGYRQNLTFNQFSTFESGARTIELPPKTSLIIIDYDYDTYFYVICYYNDTTESITYTGTVGNKYATATSSTSRPYHYFFFNKVSTLFRIEAIRKSQINVSFPPFNNCFYKSTFIISQ